jgi:hypothetical protein
MNTAAWLIMAAGMAATSLATLLIGHRPSSVVFLLLCALFVTLAVRSHSGSSDS